MLDVPVDLLDALATRVVMSTAELSGVATCTLGDKVATLKGKREEIIAALDLLFTGI